MRRFARCAEPLRTAQRSTGATPLIAMPAARTRQAGRGSSSMPAAQPGSKAVPASIMSRLTGRASGLTAGGWDNRIRAISRVRSSHTSCGRMRAR